MRGQGKDADIAQARRRSGGVASTTTCKGVGAEPAAGVTAITQTCPEDPALGGPVHGADLGRALAGRGPLHRRRLEDDRPRRPATRQTNQAFDPVAGGGDACATASGDDQPGAATYRLGEAKGGGFTLAGSPTVIADIDSPGPTSQVAARLLDVDPERRTSRSSRAASTAPHGEPRRRTPGLPAPPERLEVRERARRQARAAAERRPVRPGLERPGAGHGRQPRPAAADPRGAGRRRRRRRRSRRHRRLLDGHRRRAAPRGDPGGLGAGPRRDRRRRLRVRLAEKGTKRDDTPRRHGGRRSPARRQGQRQGLRQGRRRLPQRRQGQRPRLRRRRR